MKTHSTFLFALLLFLHTSCATTNRISSDYEKNVDYSNYETFEIVEQKHGFPLGANPINKQRIDRAILNEMLALGFEVSSEPDLLVNWFVKIETIREVDPYRDYYNRWSYYRYPYVYEYQKGTLVVDLVDQVQNKVIWHGKTSGQVYEGMPDVEEKINDAVAALIQRFAEDAKLQKAVISLNQE